MSTLATMAELASPEHPVFPSSPDRFHSPHRTPSEHEQRILTVFMKFQNPPEFDSLPKASAGESMDAIWQLDNLADMPSHPIRDQDERVLDLADTVGRHPAVFGSMGFYLALELLKSCKLMETSEFRRAFISEYVPAIPRCRWYLRRLASLRRRAKASKAQGASETSTSPERRASAREQIELVQSLPGKELMERHWRMAEILNNYRDIFQDYAAELSSSEDAVEQLWRANLAKARSDWNYHQSIVASSRVIRKVTDSVIKLLKHMAEQRA